MHEGIFNLIYFAEGGFTFSDVYNMPIYLRRFYIDKLVAQKKKEQDNIDKAKNENDKNDFSKYLSIEHYIPGDYYVKKN